MIHGIEPAEQGGHIDITASIEDNRLVICVQDDGVGVQTNSKGHNLGLANVRERLASIYEGRASLSLSDNPPHGVKATLSIPREVS